MIRKVSLLSVVYTFNDHPKTYPLKTLPKGYRIVGYNDVNYFLCESKKSGELFILEPNTETLVLMAPSIDDFIEITLKFSRIDVVLSDEAYLNRVKMLLTHYDKRLIKDDFWSDIIEEIENGIL